MTRIALAVAGVMLCAVGCEHGGTRAPVTSQASPPSEVRTVYAPDPVLDGPTDAELQAAVEALDRRIGEALGIAAADRAFGVLDLGARPAANDAPATQPIPRVAMVRSDALFYGASVPKIAIVWAHVLRRSATMDLPHQHNELSRVIKQSDNDLAARYSQLVGLEAIQRLLESPDYGLYDRTGRGGLWCGKHYGVDQPRIGDPIGDHSHAATVRACLRYYWLLEQDRLGGPEVCRLLRSIFTMPEIDLHNENFVRGLNGRNLTMIRKSGLWEDWHLDTARVQHGDRAYLLAGMTRHPKGQEYLAQMAAAVDDLLCPPDERPLAYWHDLHFFDESVLLSCPQLAAQFVATTTPSVDAVPPGTNSAAAAVAAASGEAGVRTSAPIAAASFFNEAVLSWNATVPRGGGFCVELRVGRGWDDSWSPWLYLGDWGDVSWVGPRTTAFDHGRIDVDYFRSDERFNRAQYRVRAARTGDATGDVSLKHVAVCLSDTTGIPLSAPRRPGRSILLDSIIVPTNPMAWQRRLNVPFRSQKVESQELAGRICSPTSLAMVLAYRGVERSTAAVAAMCLDATHGLYGNWPRNVQAAYALGVPGYVTRFSYWPDVERSITSGQPLIISIRVDKEGDLAGAPYKSTDGHLLVLCGFDGRGDVYVNDPAASTPEMGMTTYRRSDLERCWLRGSGGLAYVLLPADQNPER